MFVLLNPNKQTVALNLQQPEGLRAGASELVKLGRRGLRELRAAARWRSWASATSALRALKPELVMVSELPVRPDRPAAHVPGLRRPGLGDLGLQPPDRLARPRGDRARRGTITDSLSPRYVAAAIAAALLAPRAHRRGRVTSTSRRSRRPSTACRRSSCAARANGEIAGARRQSQRATAAPHAVYPCARRGSLDRDRRARRTTDWQRLVRRMGAPDWARDARFATQRGAPGAPGRSSTRSSPTGRARFDARELADGACRLRACEAGAGAGLRTICWRTPSSRTAATSCGCALATSARWRSSAPACASRMDPASCARRPEPRRAQPRDPERRARTRRRAHRRARRGARRPSDPIDSMEDLR